MKKLFLIFLLLGSVILPGCGDYEDEAPRVEVTVPANGGTGMHNGAPIAVVFNAAMNPLSLGDSTNFLVVDKATALPAEYNHNPPDTKTIVFTFTPSAGNTTVSIKATDAFLPVSCFTLTVSKNVVSANNVPMGADYQSCFCTGTAVNTCGP